MEIRRYRITGVVQGVGFRPFIHKLANDYNIKGWILNDSNGVELEVEGIKEDLDSFICDIDRKSPPLSKIDSILNTYCEVSAGVYETFFIKESVKHSSTETLVPSDTFVCKDCLQELFNKSDRRYHYPFINCTNCGPRYSIVSDMPYDRPNTTMVKFPMCKECNAEYHDISNRRYHAQPNACPVCGPRLSIADNFGNIIEPENIIEFVISKLKQGSIFAIKSVGGFHLAVNALDGSAVQELRKRKKRDSKPFAIMVKDIDSALNYVYIDDDEKKLLEGFERPIVLLKKRNNDLPESVAPRNPNLGLMLPSAPLHYLLLQDDDLPVLIMTSANISGQPIVFKNDIAIQQLNKVVDYFLLNDREIFTRVDDSIVRCMNFQLLNRKVLSPIRRSRGYAPLPVKIHTDLPPILALGSELKNTISLSKKDKVFISQHIGDLKNDKIFQAHLDCSFHLSKLLSIKPEYLAYDLHPSFRYASYIQSNSQLPAYQIQHHHAHMVSCMAENNLNSKVIGVIFDGTGYGLDNTIWGGEFLFGDCKEFRRVGKIRSFQLLGGDKAVLEPFRVAFDLLFNTYKDNFQTINIGLLTNYSSDDLNVYYKMHFNKINAFETSSMGRLFDGVSAILNICPKIEYEAQAAIELESLLDRKFELVAPYEFAIDFENDLYIFDYRPMIIGIVNEIIQSKSVADISRKFHSTMIYMILEMCKKIRDQYDINEVVLSGGVFMNEFIFGNSIFILEKNGFRVYHHHQVPTNDGGISLGQIRAAAARIGC